VIVSNKATFNKIFILCYTPLFLKAQLNSLLGRDGFYCIYWYEPKQNVPNKSLWTPPEPSYSTGTSHTFDFTDSWNKIKHKCCVCFYKYLWSKDKHLTENQSTCNILDNSEAHITKNCRLDSKANGSSESSKCNVIARVGGGLDWGRHLKLLLLGNLSLHACCRCEF
jgi:hypothetical protein